MTEKPKFEKRNLESHIIATWDIETDPFKKDRIPQPFSWGFYVAQQEIVDPNYMSEEDREFLERYKTMSKSAKKACESRYRVVLRRNRQKKKTARVYIDEQYEAVWNENPDDCMIAFIEHLENLDEPHLIFAHNGGKFDYMFLQKFIRGKLFIIGGRLVEWTYTNAKGVTHVLRDSYAILPVSLSSGGGKLDIDYRKMEKAVRKKHREEILTYLKQDCVALSEMVMAFKERYGEFYLTIAGAAFDHLKRVHPCEKTSFFFDRDLRPYYFGGRCQAFKGGEIKGDVEIYDVNSMYPYAMAEFAHPSSKDFYYGTSVTAETFFIKWRGINKGAVPCRGEDGSLTFDKPEGVFLTSIHEWKVALKYGLIVPHEIIETVNFRDSSKLNTFVEEGIKDKTNAKNKYGSNSPQYLITKLHLNAPYGKYAQDSRKFKNYEYVDPDVISEGEYIDVIEGDHFKMLVSPQDTPMEDLKFNNVATAASITGASRATLLEAIVEFSKAGATPLYCDTDSMICLKPTSEVKNLKFHPTDLGAWDFEKAGTSIYIGGKKIYALYQDEQCVKIASKGVRVIPMDIHKYLTGTDDESIKQAKNLIMNIGGEKIKQVATGNEFLFENEAPSLKLSGDSLFISRIMRSTFKETITPQCEFAD